MIIALAVICDPPEIAHHQSGMPLIAAAHATDGMNSVLHGPLSVSPMKCFPPRLYMKLGALIMSPPGHSHAVCVIRASSPDSVRPGGRDYAAEQLDWSNAS